MGIVMQTSDKRMIMAGLTYLVWTIITVYGARLAVSKPSDLSQLVQNGFGWQFFAAIAFLAVVSLANGWRDLRLFQPVRLRQWGLLWFPALFASMFLAGAFIIAPPAPSKVGWLLLNTLMVGLSEELMFRGIVLRALLARTSLLVSLIVTSVLFGSVHVLNVFVTGELLPAAIQAVAAGFSGLLFAALVVRTGSLIPAIVLHGFWDFSVFMFSIAAKAKDAGISEPVTSLWQGLAPIALVLPNLLYALFLLRKRARPQEI
jgi:membrane protease YdiL (CAAX protease family)